MDGKLINILLVEDDASVCCFVNQALSDCSKSVEFDIETAKDLSGAIELLNCKSFEVILLDPELPDSSGIDAVKQVHSLNPYTPVIVMTESADEEIGLQAIKNGADDCLVKGRISGDVLARSVHYAIERNKERMRVEKVLRDERNRAQDYLDVAGVILVVIDNDQKVSLINRKGCEILGYREKQIIGKDWCDNFVPEKARSKVKLIISSLLKGQLELFEHVENPVLTKSGEQRIVAWHNTILHDEKSRIEAILSSGEDITERKRTEQQKTELLEQVENINQELQDFAYVVSHDLKVPLRGIKTLVEWLATDYADKIDRDGKEKMALLTARVDQMHNLIDGVLQYSRVGRIHEEQTQVNLSELVSEVIETIGPDENIEIEVENELPTILCEQTRITQVFQNLLSNAIKYMDKPKGQVKVGCMEEYGYWKFSIADNGPGIQSGNFENIFQIFQTSAPQDRFESTGIGLTVVKKIIEMYGGTIWVESEVGNGSTFFFTLPREKEVAIK